MASSSVEADVRKAQWLLPAFLSTYAHATVQAYKASLDAFFSWCLREGVSPLSLTGSELQAFRYYTMQEREWGERGVDRTRTALQSFYLKAVEEGLCAETPFASALWPPRTFASDSRQVVGIGTARAMLHAAHGLGLQEGISIDLLAIHALKPRDIVNLRVQNFKPSPGVVSVGNPSRAVPLVDATADRIRRYLEDGRTHGALILTQAGTDLNRQALARIVGRVAKAAGVSPKPTGQALRNTAVALALSHGAFGKEHRSVLGFSRPEDYEPPGDYASPDVKTVLHRIARSYNAPAAGEGPSWRDVEDMVADASLHPAVPLMAAGALLEAHLRTLCEKTGISVPTESEQKIAKFAALLRAANVVREKQMREIVTWGDRRNEAAHGHFAKVKRGTALHVVEEIGKFIEAKPL